MPLLPLTSVLQTALPNLSQNGRALLGVLGCLNGHPPKSQEFAEWLGFHDRYQLARALRREGLPSLEVIGGWARTLYWMSEAEKTGTSLRELAEREHMDPAIAYRIVRRVTGRRWSEVRREGLAVTMLRFRDRCGKKAGGQAASRTAPRSMKLAVGDDVMRAPAPIVVSRPVRAPWRGSDARSRAQAAQPGHRVLQSISERVMIEGCPFDVALTAAGEALVSRPHAAAVDVLAFNPLRAVATIRVGPGPTRVIATARNAAGQNGHVAYVTTQFSEAVGVIDLHRRQQISSIAVPGHALGAVLAPGQHTLYVTTNQDRLVAISTLQRTVIGTTSIPYGIQELAVHPSGHSLLVPCWRAGVIVEVDTATLAIPRRFDVGGAVQDVIVSPDGQTLYAANEEGWLDVIHLPSGRCAATVELGTPALGLALSADATHLFIGLLNAGRVLVLQRQGLVERAVVATGGRPRLISAHPDGESVLVANEAGWVDLLR